MSNFKYRASLIIMVPGGTFDRVDVVDKQYPVMRTVINGRKVVVMLVFKVQVIQGLHVYLDLLTRKRFTVLLEIPLPSLLIPKLIQAMFLIKPPDGGFGDVPVTPPLEVVRPSFETVFPLKALVNYRIDNTGGDFIGYPVRLGRTIF